MLILKATVVSVDDKVAEVVLTEKSTRCQNCHAGCAKYRLGISNKPINLKNQGYLVGQHLELVLNESHLQAIFLAKTALPFVVFVLFIWLLLGQGELLAFTTGGVAGLVTLLFVSKACGQLLTHSIQVKKSP